MAREGHTKLRIEQRDGDGFGVTLIRSVVRSAHEPDPTPLPVLLLDPGLPDRDRDTGVARVGG